MSWSTGVPRIDPSQPQRRGATKKLRKLQKAVLPPTDTGWTPQAIQIGDYLARGIRKPGKLERAKNCRPKQIQADDRLVSKANSSQWIAWLCEAKQFHRNGLSLRSKLEANPSLKRFCEAKPIHHDGLASCEAKPIHHE